MAKTITQSKLAQMLGASRQMVYKMVQEGRIRTVLDAKGVRVVPVQEAQKWARRRAKQLRNDLDEAERFERRVARMLED